MHSWRVAILPFIDQPSLLKQYDLTEPWDGPGNRNLHASMPKVFALHGDYEPGLTKTNYLVVVGSETVFPGPRALPIKDVKDPTSSTILIVENRGAEISWMEPRDLRFAEMSLTIGSRNGISSKYDDPAVAMVDGSIQRLKRGISPVTLRALLTAAGGEVLSQDSGEWILLPDGRQRERVEP